MVKNLLSVNVLLITITKITAVTPKISVSNVLLYLKVNLEYLMNKLILMECCGVESKCTPMNGDGRVYVMINILIYLNKFFYSISKP